MSSAIPELTPVTRSSTIEGVGYDAAARTLFIQFKGGARYSYQNISGQMHEQLVAAPSIGGWFAAFIKKNPTAYPCTKLPDAEPEPKLPSFYDEQPAEVILADATDALKRIQADLLVPRSGAAHGHYLFLEHLAALLLAREDATYAQLLPMGDVVRQARRALGLVPAVKP